MSAISDTTNTPSPRGAFILFEGIDRCGKTTQVALLDKHLKEVTSGKCQALRFPDRTSHIGKLINDYLLSTADSVDVSDQTIHLLFSANRWEAAKGIEKQLLAGTTLVCDRYAYSGVAFSSAKGVAGMDMDWCRACDKNLPAPDCIIYLDMPVQEAAQRGEFGAERYEKIDFQLKVREQFQKLQDADTAAAAGGSGSGSGGGSEGGVAWHVIDARGSIEDIHAKIAAIAAATMEKAALRPLGKMFL